MRVLESKWPEKSMRGELSENGELRGGLVGEIGVHRECLAIRKCSRCDEKWHSRVDAPRTSVVVTESISLKIRLWVPKVRHMTEDILWNWRQYRVMCLNKVLALDTPGFGSQLCLKLAA